MRLGFLAAVLEALEFKQQREMRTEVETQKRRKTTTTTMTKQERPRSTFAHPVSSARPAEKETATAPLQTAPTPNPTGKLDQSDE